MEGGGEDLLDDLQPLSASMRLGLRIRRINAPIESNPMTLGL